MSLSTDARDIIDYQLSSTDRVIVAPLNWGLGHASRCIPIIKYLIDNVAEVIIVSDGNSYRLLKKEYPQLRFFSIPSPEINYKHESMLLNGLSQVFRIYEHIKLDQKIAETIVEQTKANVIISDNRFGFRSLHAKSIYITHQVNVKTGYRFLDLMASWWHQRIIKKFDHCWIVDHADDGASLAGHLSRNRSIRKASFIGPISRISRLDLDKTIDVLILLSGPEPARSQFEHDLVATLSDYQGHVMLIRGTLEPSIIQIPKHWETIDIADTNTVSTSLNTAKTIISRSGYSTIMDIYDIEARKIIVPTPGQGEQEYLAKWHDGKNGFEVVNQEEINKLGKIVSN